MELKIKPCPKNNYPRKGVLIKSSSPLVWLQEIDLLGIDLRMVQTFAIPSQEPNVLYGCLVLFHHHAPSDIGPHRYFQCFDGQLFIPENTDFYPKIVAGDWENLGARYMIMHPDFGLVKLNEEISWISLLQNSPETQARSRKPLNGISVPQKIRTFQVHMNDDDLLEELMNPKTDEEWMKNLPFDLEKVKAGNLEEIEKYIAYITQHPERAVYFGIPLDIHGASRGGWGDFNFDFGMFGMGGDPIKQDTQLQDNSERSKHSWKVLIGFIVLVVMIIFVIDSKKNNPEPTVSQVSTDLYNHHAVATAPENKVAFESGVTKIDMVIDSLYGKERRQLIHEYEQVNGTGDVILWKIDEYRLKEKKSRDSLKNVYLKKTEDLVRLKTQGYHTKILDSIRKDPANTMSKVSQKLMADDILEMRKRAIYDSLSRIYGTSRTTDPMVVFNKDSGAKTSYINVDDVERKETSLSEITWMILAIIGLVAGYSYFVRKKPLYMGGEYVSEGIKMILIILLAAALLYIFYPLIQTFGYNWLVWLLIIGVMVLLYRLFNEDMDILKSGKK